LALAQYAWADETQTWSGTLYRNGGYYGPANSDVAIESTEATQAAAAPLENGPPAHMKATAFVGTLFHPESLGNTKDSDPQIDP